MIHDQPNLHDTIDPHETLSQQEAHEAHVHVTPFWTMFWVFVILLALTALTVWSSNIHHFWIGNTMIELGATGHILIALTIAVIKAALVAAYFMHLRYDPPMNTSVVCATVFALILFIGLTLADSATRRVFDKQEHVKIIPGGTSHLVVDPETGQRTFVQGLGVVEAARQAHEAHATNPDAEPHAPAPEAAPPGDQ